MIRTVQIIWQSDCGKAHVEERSGMFWGYVGPDHVCTQLSKDKAVEIVRRKLTR
jgi:hypothetical protein